MKLRILWSGVLGCFFGLAPLGSSWANDAVRISSTVEFNSDWLEHALPDQRHYIATLRNQDVSVTFDLVPHNRFDDLLEIGETDCVLTALPDQFSSVVVAQSRIRFELRVFQRKDADLFAMSKVNIGFLVNLPRPPVPLETEMVWHDLRTIEQGVALLQAGRVDAIIGDSTHIRTYGDIGLIPAPLPPVLVPRMALVCRDTQQLRDFVTRFDEAMRGSETDASEADHGPTNNILASN